MRLKLRWKAWRGLLLLAVLLLSSVSLVQSQPQPGAAHAHTWTVCSEGCDYTSIQAAIDAAAPGDTIQVGPGEYKENLMIKKSITLVGAGREEEGKETVIEALKEGYPVIRIASEEPIEVHLKGLVITGAFGWCADWPVCPNGLMAQGRARVTLEDSRVSGNWDAGLYVRGSAILMLRNAEISDNAVGVWVGDSAMVSLTSARISGNRYDGLVIWGGAKVEVRESSFIDNKYCGVFVGSKEARVEGLSNEMRGNGADLCGYAPAHLRKPLVPQTKLTELSVPEDYADLQEAIDAIAPGGTIIVKPGIYSGSLTIWKPLILQGLGPEQTTIEALPERQLVISVISEAPRVRITGLTVTGGEEIGLLLWGTHDVSLKGNKVTGNGWVGLYLRDSCDVTVEENLIADNGYINPWTGGWGWGVYLNRAHGNHLIGNTVKWNGGGGIFLRDSRQNHIAQNTLEDNAPGHGDMVDTPSIATSGGIVLLRSDANAIEGNVLRGNTPYGIQLRFSSLNHVVGNWVGPSEREIWTMQLYVGIVIKGLSYSTDPGPRAFGNAIGHNTVVRCDAGGIWPFNPATPPPLQRDEGQWNNRDRAHRLG